MQVIPDKEFNEIFRRKLGDLEIQPSAAVWKGIVSQLDQKPVKKVVPVFWLSIAASIVVMLSVALWFANPKQQIMLKGKVENNSFAATQADSNQEIAVPEVYEESAAALNDQQLYNNVVAEESALRSSVMAVSMPAEVGPELRNEVAVTSAREMAEPSVSSGKDDMIAAVPIAPVEQPVVAFVSEEPYGEYSKQLSSPRRGKDGGDLLGNLVNYFVGKVDPRQDKIVELRADGDGGSEISGINLGILKYKSRTK